MRLRAISIKENICNVCGKRSILISRALGVCVDCIRSREQESLRYVQNAHGMSRSMFGLPVEPPRGPGARCGLCPRDCVIPEGSAGYCGVRMSSGGRLTYVSGGVEWGVLDWYYDPIPTNCVAGWFCPASTGIGYPKYAVRPGPERGYYNLAVFYGSCTLDCLYCQNWQYRRYPSMARFKRVHADELVRAADERVTCVCYFGGDPSSQIVHAIMTSRKILERSRREGRIVRICWETNGQMSLSVLKEVVKLSLVSGGIVKIDVKAWTPSVYRALTGGEIEPVIRSIKYVAQFMRERPEVPILTVSLLLVPGYVDEVEIEGFVKFVSELNPEIPVSFLAFHPDYLMDDLPPTSRRHMEYACKVAREHGIKYVHVGNEWLLGDYY